MLLDEFLNKLLSEEIGVSNRGMEKIREIIKEDYGYNYDTTSIAFSLVPTEEEVNNGVDNKALGINVTSNNYDDGNVVFVDCSLDE